MLSTKTEEIIASSIDYILQYTEEIEPIIKEISNYTKYSISILYDNTIKKVLSRNSSNNLIIKRVSLVKKYKTTTNKTTTNNTNHTIPVELRIYDTAIFNCLEKRLNHTPIDEEELDNFKHILKSFILEYKMGPINENDNDYLLYVLYNWFSENYIICIENPYHILNDTQYSHFSLYSDYDYEFLRKDTGIDVTNIFKMYEGPYRDFHADFCNLSPENVLLTPERIFKNKCFNMGIEALIVKKSNNRYITSRIELSDIICENLKE